MAIAIALFASTCGLTLLLSLYLQLSGGDSALETGLALAPLAIGRYRFTDQVATALGIAVLGTIFINATNATMITGVMVAVVLMVLAAILAVRLPRTTLSH